MFNINLFQRWFFLLNWLIGLVVGATLPFVVVYVIYKLFAAVQAFFQQ